MRGSVLFRTLVAAAGLVTLTQPVLAQKKVVVSHDEWFTGNCCLGSNEQQFLSNALGWFGVGAGKNVLIYSNNSFLSQSTLAGFFSAQSIGVTTNDAAPAASFSSYDAIFVSGNPSMDNAGLISYVMGGGNVFVIGGTGIGGPAAEAAYNNPFLNAFGLSFASSYNGLVGNIPTTGFASQGPYGAALFTGVNYVYANNGNSTSITGAPVSGVTTQVWDDGTEGVFGAAQVTTTPEPATIGLFATGLLALVPVVRRRLRHGR